MIGKSIKIFEELDSTNNFVKVNVSNLENGTVIVARKQTNGRGRRDNEWMSENGNLYFSIFLKNDLHRNDIFKYIVQSSIAIVRTLGHYGIDSLIKYPNDCLVDGFKIAGVLIESAGLSKLDYIVIGIGINVNQLDFKELNNKAISMHKVLDLRLNIENLLEEFISNYNEVIKSEYSGIFNQYIEKSVVLNKSIIYDDKEFNISSIEQDGTIIIKNGSFEQRIAFSEISLKELY